MNYKGEIMAEKKKQHQNGKDKAAGQKARQEKTLEKERPSASLLADIHDCGRGRRLHDRPHDK